MIPKSGHRFPACAKPLAQLFVWLDASAGEARPEKIMLHLRRRMGAIDLHPRRYARALRAAAFLLALAAPLGGCFTQTYQRGYVLAEGALEQIPLGATQEQVLIVLGTPSTVATVSGEVFYYISQRGEQTAFMPQKIIDQRVVAVYFDKNRRVERLANYGMQDGKIFDFIGRTTPTAGQELNYLTYVFKIFSLKS
jgi:outer membrane protein assembly factor BamE (lipoprotein component of BamABCDE complex)